MPRPSVRGKLVEHAEGVFRSRGFSGASVQDITSAAGVPKGSFYNHFTSKQELAAEIVRRYCGGRDFSALGGDGGTALERLRSHFAAAAERIRSTGVGYGCLMVTMANETPTAGEEVRSAVLEGFDAWTDALAAVIEQGQLAGEIASRRPARDLAAFVIDAFAGGALRGKVTGDRTATTRAVDIALDALRV